MRESLKPKIGVICYANYCRSPVAEQFLNKRFNRQIDFFSAGIEPIYRGGMDPRSYKFLSSEGIAQKIHQPKKISINMIKASDVIFAIDFHILEFLTKNFKKYSEKFRIFSSENSFHEIRDPFDLDEKAYQEIMVYIKKISYEIKINF